MTASKKPPQGFDPVPKRDPHVCGHSVDKFGGAWWRLSPTKPAPEICSHKAVWVSTSRTCGCGACDMALWACDQHAREHADARAAERRAWTSTTSRDGLTTVYTRVRDGMKVTERRSRPRRRS